MYGRLRGDAGPVVKLRGMMTGPRRSQTHPRATGTNLSADEGLRACTAVRRVSHGGRENTGGLAARVESRKSRNSTVPVAAWTQGEGPCAAAQ
eukprot:5762728-Pleurochrysis_carterae.AAC.1